MNDNFQRALLAKLYRSQYRDIQKLTDQTGVDPAITSSIDRLSDLLCDKADELWPRPMSEGSWSIETEDSIGPPVVVIKTKARDAGEARIWLRDAAGLGWALKQYAKHEVAQSGGSTCT